jgi:hypothetical protein
VYLKLQKIAHTLPSVKKNKFKHIHALVNMSRRSWIINSMVIHMEHDIKIIWSPDLNSEKWWMI